MLRVCNAEYEKDLVKDDFFKKCVPLHVHVQGDH